MFAQPDYVKQGKTFFGCAFVVSRTRRAAAKPRASCPESDARTPQIQDEIMAMFAVGKRL
jgi:hypothetical protein